MSKEGGQEGKPASWNRVRTFLGKNAGRLGLRRDKGPNGGATGAAASGVSPQQTGHLGRVRRGSATPGTPTGVHANGDSPQASYSPPEDDHRAGVDPSDTSVRPEQQHRLVQVLEADELEVGETTSSGLRGMCWSGIPRQRRAQCWRLLCGYEPVTRDRREADLARKRAEFQSYVTQYYSAANQDGWMGDSQKVIKKDIPRTAPNLPFFQHKKVQAMYERILVIWAQRHPATGYVQGMNDLVTPFLYVFAAEEMDREVMLSEKVAPEEVEQLIEDNAAFLQVVESDAYWCFNHLLDHIQDNYTENQPGIQQKLCKYEELLRQVDAKLAAHLESQGVLPMYYLVRYVSCLFVREFPLPLLARLWDTFLCEQGSFPDLHLYICIALVKGWADMLLMMDFAGIVAFLQSPPTDTLMTWQIDELIARAFQLQSLYRESSAVTTE
eukprot:TRINITY_DN22636_c0_g1_i1.p1 TRINITY_DN22636_c0_g1~~TRINITY_DN22636_c0_g1_i1.p1  ORF type:complete len:440 (+),score=157.53 TRINITY_DN22636_c0_g1_i1:119-1438(+)